MKGEELSRTEMAHGVLRAYQGPRLRVWEIGLEGPHVDVWPTEGHRAIYGANWPVKN